VQDGVGDSERVRLGGERVKGRQERVREEKNGSDGNVGHLIWAQF
jgi:hypothetical protein